MLSKLVLLTDEIYGKKVPKEMKGQLFLYIDTGYEVEQKEFTLKYQNRMISGDGVEWVDQDGGRDVMNRVKIKTVNHGYDMYGRANACVNNHEKRKKLVAKGSLKPKAKVLREEDVDMTDLDNAAKVNVKKGWMSQEVLDGSTIYFFYFTLLFVN